jgi:hypothetical protein
MDSSLGNLAKERNKEAPLVLSKNGCDLFSSKRGEPTAGVSLSHLRLVFQRRKTERASENVS